MKALLFTGSLIAILMLTGCSGSKPVVDDTATSAGGQAAEEINIVDESNAADTEAGIESTTDLDAGNLTLEGIEAKISPIYFGFDKYTLVAEDVETLRKNVAILQNDTATSKLASQYSIKLEGNCDEWGSDEYNFALGLKRANAVKDELINEGIKAGRITMVSYGSSSPVCTEKTQECWSKNRRVDFKLLP